MKDLKEEYAKVCNAYRKLLCEHFDIDFDNSFWVGGDVGRVLELNDYYVNFDDVIYLVDNNISFDVFSEWYDYNIRLKSIDFDIVTPNLKKWCMGCPRNSETDIIELEKMHKKVLENKQMLKDAIDNFKIKIK